MIQDNQEFIPPASFPLAHTHNYK